MGSPQAASFWRSWLLSFAVTVALVLFCVALVDRPVALSAQDWFGALHFERLVFHAPSMVGLLVVAVLVVALARRMLVLPFGRVDLAFLLGAASLVVAEVAKRALKVLFGRTWPKFAHPSFLRDGAYGFHPLHVGHPFESFPSGHMTAMCALVSVLWIFFPRLRALCVACAALLATILILGDYHFVSDVIAGSFLGTSVGIAVTSLGHALVVRTRLNPTNL